MIKNSIELLELMSKWDSVAESGHEQQADTAERIISELYEVASIYFNEKEKYNNTNNKKLYSMAVDYGRTGSVNGLFIADQKDVDKIIGKEIYFGEILGKHSEVEFTMKREYLSVVSDDVYLVTLLEKLCGKTISGYNPVNIWEENIAEDEDDE